MGVNRAVLPAPACGVTQGVKAAWGCRASHLAGSGMPAHSSTPGTRVEMRQMTEKRFTIWPILFPIKAWTLVNMQGWDSQAEIMCR